MVVAAPLLLAVVVAVLLLVVVAVPGLQEPIAVVVRGVLAIAVVHVVLLPVVQEVVLVVLILKSPLIVSEFLVVALSLLIVVLHSFFCTGRRIFACTVCCHSS